MKKFVKKIIKERIHKLLISKNNSRINDKNNTPFRGIFETIMPLENKQNLPKQEIRQIFKIRYYLQHTLNLPIYLIDKVMSYLLHHNFLHLDVSVIGLIIEELQNKSETNYLSCGASR